ncbi:hypothetical protein BDZ94DRAFT_1272484 [Collybia nuda]|uniref:Uncharacterized protein n=1 Tax=Collybia nuda TaxID=64659 RepID=A0A9P6CD41_9AGAR|nr:hypothetical protein BDZ94DRAFT_1272484 [Collybia nuda]
MFNFGCAGTATAFQMVSTRTASYNDAKWGVAFVLGARNLVFWNLIIIILRLVAQNTGKRDRANSEFAGSRFH